MEMNSLYKKLLDNMNEGAYFVEPDRKIVYWNKAAEEITGFKADEVVGNYCWDDILKHVNEDGVDLCQELCPLAATMKENKPREAEIFLHHKDGYRLPISVKCSPITNDNGEVVGGMEVFSDNSPKMSIKKRAQELERLTQIDPLTQLGNRRSIEETIDAKLSQFQRYNILFGLLFFDIDHFKNVNDHYGHNIGDEVLKMISRTVEYNIRASDFVGRWGGEEFIAIIENADTKSLLATSEKLRKLVQKSGLRSKKNSFIRVTISTGATLVNHGDDKESIIARADNLMYMSKKNGRNQVTTDYDKAA